MAVDYIGIGKRIRAARKARNWTQEKLSEMVNIEPSTMSHIERGATKLSLPTLVNIANALEVTLDELAYDSLIESAHVSAKLIDELLSDCTPSEIKALTEIMQTVKDVMRNQSGNK